MKSMMNKAMLTTLAGLALSGSAVSLAADVQDTVYDFGEAITTASRMAEKKIDVPADTTVITAETIEKGNYSKVSDALKANNVPVVQKGFASFAELNGDTRVLVLVNGRKMNWEHLIISGDNNAVDIDQIPIENIQRIEVVKGPNSALYGSRAVAGVINIITKEPEEGNKTTVRAEYGTWKDRKASIVTQGGDMNNRYMISYSKERRNNYNYKDTNGNTHEFPASYINRDMLTARYDHNYSDDRLSLEFTRSEKKDGYGISLNNPLTGDGYGPKNSLESIATGYALTYTFGALTEGEGTYVRMYRNTETSDSQFGIERTPYTHDLSVDVLEGQKTWQLNDHTLVIGGEYHNEHIWEMNAGANMNRVSITKSVYVEDKWDMGDNWALNYGTRYEHNDFFGGDWASHVGINKKLSNDTHVYLAWGQAINNPTLKMLYSTAPNWKANKDLVKETGHTTTLGIDSRINDKLSVSASVYDSRLKNALDWQQLNKEEGRYINIHKEKRRGLNLNATYQMDEAWRLKAGYSYSKIDRTNIDGSAVLTSGDNRRPNAYSMELSYDKNKWNVSTQLNYVTGRSVNAYTDSSYFTWDMNVNYQINDTTKVYAKGFNLTNESYEIEPNSYNKGAYAMPERHFVIGMEHSF